MYGSFWLQCRSTEAEKERFMRDIPKLHQKKAKLTQASQLFKDRLGWGKDDTETWEGYIKFQEGRIREGRIREGRIREEETRRLKERATLLQADEEEKKRLENERRQRIEQGAIEAYKRQQKNFQTRTAENKELFCEELKKLNLNLGDKEIETLLGSSKLDFTPTVNTNADAIIRPIVSLQQPSHDDAAVLQTRSKNTGKTTSSRITGRFRRLALVRLLYVSR